MTSPPMSPSFYNEDTSSSFGEGNTSSGVEDNQSEDIYGYNYDYEVLDNNKINEQLHSSVNRLVSILNVTDTEARYVLNNNQWNGDKIIDTFLGLASHEEFRHRFGLFIPMDHLAAVQQECDICFRDFKDSGNAQLVGTNDCKHRFCLDCWNDYLMERVMTELPGGIVMCAAYKCEALVEDATVLCWLRDAKTKESFQSGMTNMYVQQNPRLRWCPGADCVYAISVSCVQSRSVRCRCEHEFCFGCGDVPHEPLDCSMMERWNPIKIRQESTDDWLLKYTKPCRRCGIHIQKTGGCNYMYCMACKTTFCWLCGGAWKNADNHFKHACNEYREDKGGGHASKGPGSASSARRDHYIARYSNHLISAQFERHLNQLIVDRIAYLEKNENIAYTNAQFIHRAFRGLIECRRVLSATYVFAYFTAECNQLHIFLDNQRDLETATEQLSYMLEHEEITGANLTQFREDVETKLSYCKRRQATLSSHVREGFMLGWWNDADAEQAAMQLLPDEAHAN